MRSSKGVSDVALSLFSNPPVMAVLLWNKIVTTFLAILEQCRLLPKPLEWPQLLCMFDFKSLKKLQLKKV